MKARSDWFLSDPSGLVTYRRYRSPGSLGIPSGRPSSLATPCAPPLGQAPPLPVSAPPVPSNIAAIGANPSTASSLEAPWTAVAGKPPEGGGGGGPAQGHEARPNVALRRRLSDKDKERRLVR